MRNMRAFWVVVLVSGLFAACGTESQDFQEQQKPETLPGFIVVKQDANGKLSYAQTNEDLTIKEDFVALNDSHELSWELAHDNQVYDETGLDEMNDGEGYKLVDSSTIDQIGERPKLIIVQTGTQKNALSVDPQEPSGNLTDWWWAPQTTFFYRPALVNPFNNFTYFYTPAYTFVTPTGRFFVNSYWYY